MATGQRVKDNGWRQGSFLPSDMALALAAKHACKDATHAVVISQDCDVTHPDLSAEPYAEILFLKSLDAINPGLQDGKSSRILHLQVFEGTKTLLFEAQPWNQARIGREMLVDARPDFSLSIPSGTQRGMIQWIADRYTRTGFPDEFVKRIEVIDEPLKRLMKKEGQAFWRILLIINPDEEIGTAEDYSIDVVCAIWPEFWDDPKIRAKTVAAGEKFKTLIESCNGVNLDAYELTTTDEIPLSYLHQYRPWDIFNYLSHRDLLRGNAS